MIRRKLLTKLSPSTACTTSKITARVEIQVYKTICSLQVNNKRVQNNLHPSQQTDIIHQTGSTGIQNVLDNSMVWYLIFGERYMYVMSF